MHKTLIDGDLLLTLLDMLTDQQAIAAAMVAYGIDKDKGTQDSFLSRLVDSLECHTPAPIAIQYDEDGEVAQNVPFAESDRLWLIIYQVDTSGQPDEPYLGYLDSAVWQFKDELGLAAKGHATHFVVVPAHPIKGFEAPTVGNEVI